MQEKNNKKEKSSFSITIRKGTPEDIPFIKKCLVDSWVKHAKHEPGLLDEERMRQSDVESYYKKALESEDSVVLIAEIENERAGFIRADVKQIPDFFKENRIFYLDDTYVVLKFRRKGVARTLTLKIEEIAKQRGIKRIQSRIYTYNKSMQKLRRSMGYRSPHATWDKVLD